jgi:NADH-quinone oxidoreductase subunit C/D
MSDATMVAGDPAVEVPAVEAPAIDHPFAQAVPGAVIGKYAEESDNALVVAPGKLLEFLTYLRDQEGYDYLGNLSCTDFSAYKGKLRAGVSERFDVVYHIYNTKQGGGPVSLRVRVPKDDTIPSATSVYPGANLQEREVYDLYGIKFSGHPNLRRVLMWEGFNGHPMRKDWKEAYFEEESKPFRSRHPGGKYQWHEDKLPWGGNQTYPAGWDPASWQEPVSYVPVSQAPPDPHYHGRVDTRDQSHVVGRLYSQ